MNHYILKLTTGEFVYGVITDISDKKMVIVDNPLTWEEYETADGGVGTALVKYINGTKETRIPISTSSIISMASMSENFSYFYDAAVACQKITDEAYDERLDYMTRRMVMLVMEHQAKEAADALGKDALVSYSDITFH